MGQDASGVKIAADFIKKSEAIFIGAGAGMGLTPACRIFVVRRDSGRRIPCSVRGGFDSKTWLTPVGLQQIPDRHGDFSGIALISFEKKPHISVSEYCSNGQVIFSIEHLYSRVM